MNMIATSHYKKLQLEKNVHNIYFNEDVRFMHDDTMIIEKLRIKEIEIRDEKPARTPNFNIQLTSIEIPS